MDLIDRQPEKRTDKRTETHACDLMSRQAAIDALDVLCQEHRYKIPGKWETYSQYNEAWQDALDRAEGAIGNLPSAQQELIRCKDCKHNPKHEWFGCPMSHLSEKQRPDTAWCWRAERRTNEL